MPTAPALFWPGYYRFTALLRRGNIHTTVIKDFADKETERLWERRHSKAIPADLHRRALKKLTQIHLAGDLYDLRVPPGNRLEQLGGDRKGQHSVRINDQFRVCFVWEDGDAYEVEVTDYH